MHNGPPTTCVLRTAWVINAMRWLTALALSASVWALLIGALFAFEAHADDTRRVLVIHTDYGGEISKREIALAAMRVQTDEVQVQGVCASACTLILATKYNFKVCAGPDAKFGFHKPYQVDMNGTPGVGYDFTAKADRGWTNMFLNQFSAKLRAHLNNQYIPSTAHGDSIAYVYWLQGAELHKFVPLCTHTINRV